MIWITLDLKTFLPIGDLILLYELLERHALSGRPCGGGQRQNFDFSESGLLLAGWVTPALIKFNPGTAPFILTDVGDSPPDLMDFRPPGSPAGFVQGDLFFTADTRSWDFSGVRIEDGTVLTAQIEVVPLPAPILPLGAPLESRVPDKTSVRL